MKCPICKKEVPPDNADFPFCSERCRLIDLGNWSAERYRIPQSPESVPADEDGEDE